MMRWLTENAILVCTHEMGIVVNTTSQNLVRIKNRRVLIKSNPENRRIDNCPNKGPSIKPCLMTLKVKRGYSSFIRINGQSICLSTISGFTDGTPPGIIKYKVRSAGQRLVSEL